MDTSLALILRGLQLLNKFDPECMIFLVWQNSFEFVADLIKISDDRKTYFLLSMLENTVYALIRTRVAPINPFDLSYELLISKLEEIFSPYQGKLAARYRFDIRNQIEGESVKQYADALRKLIDKCNFGIKESTYLLIRFIIGLKSHPTQVKLLQTRNLTFDNAIYLAGRMEFYEKQYYDARRLAEMVHRQTENTGITDR